MTQTLEHVPASSDNEQLIMQINEPAAGPDFNFSEYADYRIENNRLGLGAEAVKSALANSQAIISEATLGDGGSETGPEDISEMIATAREELKGLSRLEKRQFNNYLAKSSSSAWLDSRLGLEKKKLNRRKNYVDKLLERDEKSGEYTVDDDLMMNFLEWHNHDLVQRQQEVDRRDEYYKAAFKHKFTKAIIDGWVPAWAGERTDERLNRTVIAVDDGFETMHGYYSGVAANALRTKTDDQEIIFAPGMGLDPEKILTHEFVHVMDGKAEKGKAAQGLYKLVSDYRTYPGVALNEAVVEHLADAMYKGEGIDEIDPRSSVRSGAVYRKERALLNILANMGKHKIDVRLFIAAHFDEGEHTDEQGRTYIEALKDQIKSAFPDIDVLDELGKLESTKEVHAYTQQLRKRVGHAYPTSSEVKLGGKLVATGLAASAIVMGTGKVMDAIEGPTYSPSYTDVSPGYSTYKTEQKQYGSTSSYYDQGQIDGAIDEALDSYLNAPPPHGLGGMTPQGPDTYTAPEEPYVITLPPMDNHYFSPPEVQHLGTDSWDEPRNTPR